MNHVVYGRGGYQQIGQAGRALLAEVLVKVALAQVCIDQQDGKRLAGGAVRRQG